MADLIDPDADVLPCPFCGGKAEAIEGYATEQVWAHGVFHRVYCTACQSRQHFHRAREEAVAAWNRRTPADLSAAEAAAARETVERCAEACKALAMEWLDKSNKSFLEGDLTEMRRRLAAMNAFGVASVAIRALSTPAPGALERYVAGKVAEAVAETWQEAAEIVRQTPVMGRVHRDPLRVDEDAAETLKEAERSIRARSAEARQAGEVGDE